MTLFGRRTGLKIIIFIVIISLLQVSCFHRSKVRQVPGFAQQPLLDCDSFYTSDLVGCKEKVPLKSNPGLGVISAAAGLTNSSKVAVVIDTRIQHNSKFFPLLLHIGAVLGPSWLVYVYTNQAGVDAFSNSDVMRRAVSSGRLNLFALPIEVTFPNVDEYSAFMTSRWIWDSLAPIEHVLIFQADSILCANAPKNVDEFLDWDFIGAPIDPAYGHGYNGGLSLRRRSSILKVLEHFSWEDSRPLFEDQWYHERLLELQKKDYKAIQLPPIDVAKMFAVETIDYPRPVGLHQPRRFPKNEELSIDDYCPEYTLCVEYGDR